MIRRALFNLKYRLSLLLSLLFIGSNHFGFGQVVYGDVTNLNSDLHFYINASEPLSFEEALKKWNQGEFEEHKSDDPINFGYNPSDFWFYVDFTVEASSERVLHLPYPYHQNIDLFINIDGEWAKYSSGNLTPFKTRGSLKPESFAWPLEFQHAGEVKLLINVRSRAPVIMSVEMHSVEHYVNISNTTNLLYGLFFGILSIMVLYNLFLFVIIRDKAYLYYVILVLANIAVFASVTGYAFHYLHPENPNVNFYIREFLITFLIIPTSLFAITFLDLKRYSVILYNILSVMIVIGVVLSILILFGITFGFSSFIISIHAPLLLFTGIVVRIRGNDNASFYILAWSGYLLGGMAMTLRNSGVLPATFVTDHGAEIGTVLDVFLLALALAYRYKQIRNERSRLYRENIELVEKQNVLLEDKVKERTKMLDSTLEIVQKQHDDLNLKRLENEASIKYALKIQEAMLPAKKNVAATFSDFVLFQKPKQTVSGDFLFFHKQDHKVFIAVADCTGHGVPGALMSMIGYNLFYDAVTIGNIYEPDQILNYVEDNLNLRLHQSDKILQDGMEVALVVIDNKNKKISFSGAQRPILITSPSRDMTFIKGTKKAIGGHMQSVDKQFIKHNIEFEPGSMIYLYSDGFQDQFGGENNKKYMTKQLKVLLESIATKSGQEQESALSAEFDKWKGEHEQVDDVLILGIRV